MLRLIIVLVIMAIIDIYSFQALREWVRPYSDWTRRISYGIYWALTALAVLYLLINVFEWNESWSKSMKTLGRAFVFLVYVCKIPIVGILLIDDLRRGITYVINQLSPTANYDVSRSRFLSSFGLLMGGIPFATLTYGIVRNQYRFKRYAADVPVEGLPKELDGLKIVQISDMHSGSWTRLEPLQRAVDMINEEAADVVCFTGDIVNDKAEEMEPFVNIFKQISAKHGVYSVLGNHDYGDYAQWKDKAAKQANMEQLFDVHRRLGWDLLRDEHRLLEINGRKFGVLGVENWSAKRFGKRGDLKKAHAGSEVADAKILLSHDPTHWEAQVQNYPDIDLTLSGHTHGFQFGIEIPGIRWSPAQYIYKQWAGLYQAGRQHLYVNRGLGFLGYPGRVGILPEISVLTLRTA
ncbi:MAG: metallophosphoesterase [Bacteroidota bacterium]